MKVRSRPFIDWPYGSTGLTNRLLVMKRAVMSSCCGDTTKPSEITQPKTQPISTTVLFASLVDRPSESSLYLLTNCKRNATNAMRIFRRQLNISATIQKRNAPKCEFVTSNSTFRRLPTTNGMLLMRKFTANIYATANHKRNAPNVNFSPPTQHFRDYYNASRPPGLAHYHTVSTSAIP